MSSSSSSSSSSTSGSSSSTSGSSSSTYIQAVKRECMSKNLTKFKVKVHRVAV